MIYTLTLNPALDYVQVVDTPRLGQLNRSSHSYYAAGGKGINVSRALAAQGLASIAVVPLGGAFGEFIRTQLEQDAYTLELIPIQGESRCNVKVMDARAQLTEFNAAGASLSDTELAACTTLLANRLGPADSLVLSGSLPPGVPNSLYRDLVQLARTRGAQSYVDASGEALRLALSARPTLVKPNLVEAEQLLGKAINTWRDAADATSQLRHLGAEHVALSMGAFGVLFDTNEGSVLTRAPTVQVTNTTGCGDSLLAAVLYGVEQGFKQSQLARYMTAFASAKASMPGGHFPGQDEAATLIGSVRSSSPPTVPDTPLSQPLD